MPVVYLLVGAPPLSSIRVKVCEMTLKHVL